MKMTDLRRLTGASLILDRPGAAAEIELSDQQGGVLVALWRRHVKQLLDAVGWTEEVIRARAYPGGASLAISAPLDGLDAATDILELAWTAACDQLEGNACADLASAAKKLRDQIAEERNTRLVALARAADLHGVTFLNGEDRVSLGLGIGGILWPENELPEPDDIDWEGLHDVPVALVTGTNGKSTTVRLTAAIGRAAGRTVGLSSSDWVRVGNDIIDEGDYSGPGGARRAVRDPRVDLAVLEVARGGLLRRGLSIPRARAGLVTNVALDHMGEYGITDLAALAEAKFLITRSIEPGGRLVLNADDPHVVRQAMTYSGEITWVTLDASAPWLAGWAESGGRAAVFEDDHLVLLRGTERTPILEVADFPLAMGGIAKFNLANGIAAIALADALDLPVEAMAKGLASFEASPDENPGRGNFLDLGGVKVLVDFAHNPHGLAALIEAIKQLPAKRRLVLLGQAGDRRDDDIRALVHTVWDAKPDRIIVKEMEKALRGRAAGEVPALIARELTSLGAPSEIVCQAASEVEATRQALDWAAPGDFLILLLHTERKAALALLQELQERDWQPGQPLES